MRHLALAFTNDGLDDHTMMSRIMIMLLFVVTRLNLLD